MSALRGWFAVFGVVLACARVDGAESAPERKAISIASVKRSQPVDFNKEIVPLLKGSCLACHSKSNSKGELVLESVESLLKGGESGPAVVPKQPGKSLLLQLASHQKRPIMPPRDNKANAPNLTPEQLGLMELWIAQGAKAGSGGVTEIKLGTLPDSLRSIYAVAVNADGSLAAAARGGRIHWYDLVGGREIAECVDPLLSQGAHQDFVQALALSPDGQTLASGSFQEVKIWKRGSGAPQAQELRVDAGKVTVARLDGSGTKLAWAGEQGELGIQDIKTGKTLRRLSTKGPRWRALGWRAGGESVAGLDENGGVWSWELQSGQRRSLGESGEKGKVIQADFNSKATIALRVFESGKLEWLEIGAETSQVKGSWRVDITQISGLGAPELAEKGGVAAFLDGTLKWVKQGSAELAGGWTLPRGGIRVEMADSGRHVAALGADGVLKLGELGAAKPAQELKFDPSLGLQAEDADRRATFFAGDVDYFKAALNKVNKELEEESSRRKKAQEAMPGLSKKAEELDKARETATKAGNEARLAFEARDHQLKGATNLFTQFLGTAKGVVGARVPENDLKSMVDRVTKEALAEFKQIQEKWTAASNALAKAEADFKKASEDKVRGEEEVELSGKAEAKAQEAVGKAKELVTQAENRKVAAEKLKIERERIWQQSAVNWSHFEFERGGKVLTAMARDGRRARWRVEDGKAFAPDPVGEREAGGGTSSDSKARGHQNVAENDESRTGALVADLSHPGLAVWSEGRGRWSIRREPMDWTLDRTLKGTSSTGKKASLDHRISDRVNVLRFSPDGRSLVAGAGEPSRGGELWVWRLPQFQTTGPLTKLHSDTVLGLAFSEDGKSLLTSGSDRFVRMVNTETWEVVKSFEGHTHHVQGVSWKPGNRMLASAGADNMVKVWDAVSGERKKNLEGFGKEVTSLGFVPWSAQLVAAAGDGQVLLMKETGETVRALGRRYDFMYALGLSSDGRWAAGGGEDGALRVWDLATGKEVWELK